MIRDSVTNPFLWLYYTYLRTYQVRPADLDDMCDGLTCESARARAEQIMTEQ